jgi:hypothetical protein
MFLLAWLGCFSISSGLVMAMAGKAGDAKKKIVGKMKAVGGKEKEGKEKDNLDRSNYLVQMQTGSANNKLNTNQESAWDFYKSLGRYDEKKKAIVAAWKVDKGMGKWKNTFSESFGKETTKEKELLEGYCTKLFGSIFV